MATLTARLNKLDGTVSKIKKQIFDEYAKSLPIEDLMAEINSLEGLRQKSQVLDEFALEVQPWTARPDLWREAIRKVVGTNEEESHNEIRLHAVMKIGSRAK